MIVKIKKDQNLIIVVDRAYLQILQIIIAVI